MRKALYVLVLIIGSLQIVGFVSNVQPIRSLGVVTAASPLPLVFSEVKGVETFAGDFYMQWTDQNGVEEKVLMTPELYSKLCGPYNRRNIFGAAIAYGPVLPDHVWQPILNYGICNEVLSNELELSFNKETFTVEIDTRTAGRNDHWTLQPDCSQ